jgi:NAD(P)H-dependent FMN reductase
MTDTITILGMAGSLRQSSFNAALLRAAAAAAPAGCTVDIASIRGIPLYDGDVEEATGIPAVVETLKERVAAADGLLLVTPEYNNSIPGVFKNAIDWLSRPPQDIPRVFGGRPVAFMGATPGGMGTVHAQTAWLPVLRTLSMQPWFGSQLYVSGAHNVFDASGTLLDAQLRERLRLYMAGFAAFVQRRS